MTTTSTTPPLISPLPRLIVSSAIFVATTFMLVLFGRETDAEFGAALGWLSSHAAYIGVVLYFFFGVLPLLVATFVGAAKGSRSFLLYGVSYCIATLTLVTIVLAGRLATSLPVIAR